MSMNKIYFYVAVMISSMLISCGGDSSASNKKNELKDVNKTSKKINLNGEIRFSTKKIHKKYESKNHSFEITIDYPLEGNESILNNIRNWINLKCSEMCFGETYSGDLSDIGAFISFYTKTLKQSIEKDEAECSDCGGYLINININQEQAPNGFISLSSSIQTCGASCGYENDAATFRIKDGHQLSFNEIFYSNASYSWNLKDVLLLNKEEGYGYPDGDDKINVEDLSFALFPDRVMFVNRQSLKGSGRMNLKGSDLDDYLTDYGKKIMGITPGFKIPSFNKLFLLYANEIYGEFVKANKIKNYILKMGFNQIYYNERKEENDFYPGETDEQYCNMYDMVFGNDAKIKSISKKLESDGKYYPVVKLAPNGDDFFVIDLLGYSDCWLNSMTIRLSNPTIWNKLKKEFHNTDLESNSEESYSDGLFRYKDKKGEDNYLSVSFDKDDDGFYCIYFDGER